MKIKFICLSFLMLTANLFAAVNNKPISLVEANNNEADEAGLYNEEFPAAAGTGKLTEASDKIPTADEYEEVTDTEENVESKEPISLNKSSETSPAPVQNKAPVEAPIKAYNKFAEAPSTGPGSNLHNDPTSNSAPVSIEPKTSMPIQPIFTPQQNVVQSTRGKLENSTRKCTSEINELYSRQKDVPRAKMQQFQIRIGEAHESCERMKQDLETIKNAERSAEQAMNNYDRNIRQARDSSK